MACSFHHTGAYNPSLSSSRILGRDGGGGYWVELLEAKSGYAFACDRCRGLAKPWCVKVCREEKELLAILDIFGSLGQEAMKSGGSGV